MFTNVKRKEWWKAAGVRCAKTMAQTAVALIGTATLISDIDWVAVGSGSGSGVGASHSSDAHILRLSFSIVTATFEQVSSPIW